MIVGLRGNDTVGGVGNGARRDCRRASATTACGATTATTRSSAAAATTPCGATTATSRPVRRRGRGRFAWRRRQRRACRGARTPDKSRATRAPTPPTRAASRGAVCPSQNLGRKRVSRRLSRRSDSVGRTRLRRSRSRSNRQPATREPERPGDRARAARMEPGPELSSLPLDGAAVVVAGSARRDLEFVSVPEDMVRVSSPPRLRRRRWLGLTVLVALLGLLDAHGRQRLPALSGSAQRPTLSPEIEFASRPIPTAAARPAMARAAPVARRRRSSGPRLAPLGQGFVKGRVSSR